MCALAARTRVERIVCGPDTSLAEIGAAVELRLGASIMTRWLAGSFDRQRTRRSVVAGARARAGRLDGARRWGRCASPTAAHPRRRPPTAVPARRLPRQRLGAQRGARAARRPSRLSSCSPQAGGAGAVGCRRACAETSRCSSGMRSRERGCSRATSSACARCSCTTAPARCRFASEIRNLLALLPRRPAPDRVSVAHWITMGHRPGSATLYEGVRRLNPGAMLLLDRSGAREASYWQPRFQPAARGAGSTAHGAGARGARRCGRAADRGGRRDGRADERRPGLRRRSRPSPRSRRQGRCPRIPPCSRSTRRSTSRR